jgi:ubiquinone/menaquinone biosynthesis C-methylase UbiE
MLKKFRLDLTGKNLLEVGCGAGYGIVQIYHKFNPSNLFAFDINPKMVALSRGRVKKMKIPAQISRGDVLKISTPIEKFDAVFAFTVLHHVEKWQIGLREINRVLKRGGLLFIEEICERSLNRFERYLKVYHPRKARFTWKMFYSGLSGAGFKVLRDFKFLGDLGFFLCVKERSR